MFRTLPVAPVVSPSLHQTPPPPIGVVMPPATNDWHYASLPQSKERDGFSSPMQRTLYLCYNDKNRTETSPTYCTLRGKTRKTTYVSLDLCSCRNLRFTSQAQLWQLRIQLYQSLNDLAKILVESYLCQDALAKLHGHTFQVGQLNVNNQIVHWIFLRPSWIPRIIRIYWLKYWIHIDQGQPPPTACLRPIEIFYAKLRMQLKGKATGKTQ